MTTPQAYQVLARAYRPQSFDDLIGQEAMVRTLTNAFAAGRIAHAFMLTGVRGVGKTTTARLLARALNYAQDDAGPKDAGPNDVDPKDGPRLALNPPGVHCAAIAASNHPDVMEMDAASRTGVGDIREILESVRYAPVSARYKVYIIDEVHMLSTSAFNALLKTLEEPPAHVKFIFATTEIRKVPVTVLSRCQRFDLRRVEADRLVAHLSAIADKEGVSIDVDALRLIARASEGSVRDALSLLDQAIVQGGEVDANAVRGMLGLADRTESFALFCDLLNADEAGALARLDALNAAGADPISVMRDLLDHCHDATRAKALGEAVRLAEASDQVARIHALAAATPMGLFARAWQMLLKGYEETRSAPDAAAAAEMALLRVALGARLPAPEDAARIMAGGGPTEQSSSGPSSSHPSSSGPSSSGSGSAQPDTSDPSSGDGAPAGASGASGRAASPTDGDSAAARASGAPEPARLEVSGAAGEARSQRASPSARLTSVSGGAGTGAAAALRLAPSQDELAPAELVSDERATEAARQSRDGRHAPSTDNRHRDDLGAAEAGPPLEAYEGDPGAEPYGDAGHREYDGPNDPGPDRAVYQPDDPHMPATLGEISALAAAKRDLMLWYDIEKFARPVRIAPGRVEFQPVDGAPRDLAARLARRLQEWTGERWLVSGDDKAKGGETLAEARAREHAALLEAVRQEPAVLAVLEAWPGADILKVRPRVASDPPGGA